MSEQLKHGAALQWDQTTNTYTRIPDPVSEMTSAAFRKVSGVARPAHGVPFVFVKAVPESSVPPSVLADLRGESRRPVTRARGWARWGEELRQAGVGGSAPDWAVRQVRQERILAKQRAASRGEHE